MPWCNLLIDLNGKQIPPYKISIKINLFKIILGIFKCPEKSFSKTKFRFRNYLKIVFCRKYMKYYIFLETFNICSTKQDYIFVLKKWYRRIVAQYFQ